jgi:ABC-2 type transport system ATP-binding protein
VIQLAIIELEDVEKSYGSHQVLEGVNIEVEEGEIYGILGPNGVGKTTLFQTVMGLLKPDAGTIKIKGSEKKGKKVRRELGYLPSDISFYGDMTARENLRFFSRLAEKEPDIDSLLEQVDLLDSGDRKVGDFSTGMKKRLGIAQSLIKDPEIIIYDEPTTGLDPEGKRNFRRHVEKINREKNKTVIISSHVTAEISPLCDRFGVLYDGEIVASGTREELNQETDSDLRVSLKTDETGKAEEILDDRGYSYERDRERISIMMEKDQRSELFDALMKNQVSVKDFSLEEETLETAYLKLTGDR